MPVGSGAQVSAGGEGLRGSGPTPSAGYTPAVVVDQHDHELALAQLTAAAVAAERLDRAYASIERRLDRLAAVLDLVPVPAPVSPGQLRLVADG